MSFFLIDENTLNNIADTIRIKSKTNNPILGSEIANAINNISTGSPFMEGEAIAWDANNIYMGDGITDISNGKYRNLFNLQYFFPSFSPSTLIIGNNVVNAFNAFNQYPSGAYISNVICGENVVNYNGTFDSRTDTHFNGVPHIGNSVKDMGYCYHGCGGLGGSQSAPFTLRIPDSVVFMPNAFSGCTNQNFRPDVIIGNNVSYAPNAFSPVPFMNSIAFACEIGTDNLGNLNAAFTGCSNATGTGYIGNAYDTFSAYAGCLNITGPTYVGDRLMNLHGSTFSGCRNLSGAASCGNNVRWMNDAYAHTNVSIAACGPQVESMINAYFDCRSLTEANIGDNVILAISSFANCPLLTNPVMGNNVVHMNNLYSGCSNLTGAPLCGDKVVAMSGAYNGCSLISGEPAISPMTSVIMNNAYQGCPNIYGNMYLITRVSGYSFNVDNMFNGRDPSKRLNIFIQSFNYVSTNSETGETQTHYDSPWGNIIKSQNIIGTPLEWMNMTNGFYNETANIYVYDNYNYKNYKDGKDASWAWTYGNPGANNDTFANVYDVEATNIYGAFARSTYLGEFVCSNNVVNMGMCYRECSSIRSPFVCGENVIDMSRAYETCRNGYGDYVSGPNVENMFNTYFSTAAEGVLACGPKVINFANCYAFCFNSTGQPVCGDNVVDMNCTYMQCRNLTGSAAIGSNVKWMNFTYYDCSNLTGDVIIPNNVIEANSTFFNCVNLNGNAFIPKSCIYHNGIFDNCSNLKRIVFEDGIPEIRNNACNGCLNANVYIPKNILSVNSYSLSKVNRVCYYGDLSTNSWGAKSYGHHEYDPDNLPNKVEPTCEEAGSTGLFSCKYCGVEASEEDIAILPPLGHDINEATGLCNRCGKHFIKGEGEVTMKWEEVKSGTYKFIEIDTNKYQSNNKNVSASIADTTWQIQIEGTENQIASISWEVESESASYDYLQIFVDGTKVVGPVGGSLQKNTFTQELTPGQHTLQATYRKDNSGNTGADAATLTLTPIVANIITWVENV